MLLALLACSDSGLHALQPDVMGAVPAIAVTPDRLDFWSVGTGEVSVLPFTIWSTGDALLSVDDIVVSGAGSFTVLAEETSFYLTSGDAFEIEVAFSPLEPGAAEAEVLVTSDDPEHPEVPVLLSGEGEVPQLVITPDSWDFGSLALGCSDTVDLTLQNVGTDTLSVESWTYTGDGFTVTPALEPPFELEPYDYTTATVTYAPVDAGAVEGTLSVVSNDPRGVVTAVQTGEGLGADAQVDTFPTETDPPVDILFAVDQSASMDDDAAGLAAALSTFIDTLGTVTSDWHLGVVTTDEACLNGGVLDISSTDIAATFTSSVSFGDDRDIVHDEALFQIVDAALVETASGGCNEGFLRDGAPLHIIVVSDEPERSTEEASVWTWDWYLDRYRDYVASEPLLVVSGVVDADDCNEGDAGYAEAIAATGGEHLSICTGDWGDRLATLGSASLAYAWTFTLSEVPVEASVEVAVDGATWASGWTYDATLNAVVMEGLSAGSTVVVTYDLATECF